MSNAMPLFPCTWGPSHTERRVVSRRGPAFPYLLPGRLHTWVSAPSLPPPTPPPPSAWGISTPPTSHRLTLLSPFLPSHLACTLDSYRRCALFLYITLSNYALRRSILLISPPPAPPFSILTQRLTHRKCSVPLNTWRDFFLKNV